MMRRKKCTDEEVYRHICEFREEHGYSPSVRELCRKTGIKSSSTMHTRLRTMEYLGMVRSDSGKARSIVPVPESDWSANADA